PVRHGWACPGHPRTGGCTTSAVAPPAGVGGRDTPGHDGERACRREAGWLHPRFTLTRMGTRSRERAPCTPRTSCPKRAARESISRAVRQSPAWLTNLVTR